MAGLIRINPLLQGLSRHSIQPMSTITTKWLASHDKKKWKAESDVAVLYGAHSAAKSYLEQSQNLYVYLPTTSKQNNDGGFYDERRVEETTEVASSLRKLLTESPDLKYKFVGNLLEGITAFKARFPQVTDSFLKKANPFTKIIAGSLFSLDFETLKKELPIIRQTAIPWINLLLSEQPKNIQDAETQFQLYCQKIIEISPLLHKNDLFAIKASAFFTEEELSTKRVLNQEKILLIQHKLLEFHQAYGIKFVVDSEPLYDKRILDIFLSIAAVTNKKDDLVNITIPARYPDQSFTMLANLFEAVQLNAIKLSIKLVKGAPYGINKGDLEMLSMLDIQNRKKLNDYLEKKQLPLFMNYNSVATTFEETDAQFDLLSNTISFLQSKK